MYKRQVILIVPREAVQVVLVTTDLIVGGQNNLVIVCAQVAVLPQASTAVNILVLEDEQLDVDTAPSVNVTVAVLHASVAVAVPSAAEIADEVGLQPRASLA